MKYSEPLDSAGRPDLEGHYIDAIPAQGIPGSIVGAGAVEPPQREIVNAIIAAGLVPDPNDLTQLMQAITKIAERNVYKTGDIRIWGGTLEDIPEGWAFYGFVG